MKHTGEIPSDRANRIADAVEDIERNVSRLREIQDLPRSEYTADSNQDLWDSVERKFEKITEAALDIADQILKQERGSAPRHRKQKFTDLETEGIIDPELGQQLRESAGFRDVLAHTYGPIINDDIVYNTLQQSLTRYVDFVAAVDTYFSALTEEE